VAATFGAAGTYEVRWKADATAVPVTIGHASGQALQCIFAPRVTDDRNDTPWLTLLPKAAPRTSGFMADYVKQTSVHRFLIDERFAFDAQANVGLGFGASLGDGNAATTREVDTFLGEALAAKASLVLRVTVPSATIPDPKTVTAFRQYVSDAARRCRGMMRAIVVMPEARTEETAEGLAAYRAFYLAGYEAAKGQSKNIVMLGAGTAQATQALILKQNLGAYLDGVAVTDAAVQPMMITAEGGAKRPLWVLPPLAADPWHVLPPTPPVAALALGAVVAPVPPPGIDRGVTAHLMGGAVLIQRVRLPVALDPATQPIEAAEGAVPFNELPFIAVFQGDGFALAAIAGLSAGTPIDAVYPELARTRTVVSPVTPDDEPAYANLEIGDDTHTMRVVDGEGSPVECRVGDSLYVPAGDKMVYVLQGGTADELAGSIRPGVLNRVPLVSIRAIQGEAGITVRLTNIRPAEVGGAVRLFAQGEGGKPALLAEKAFAPILPGRTVEVPLEAGAPATEKPLIAEVVTSTQVQRTAVMVETK